MKETLVQILDTAPHGAVGVGPTSQELADVLLERLRCDTCVHWDHFEQAVDAGSCDEVDRLTTPDFFCARWEAR